MQKVLLFSTFVTVFVAASAAGDSALANDNPASAAVFEKANLIAHRHLGEHTRTLNHRQLSSRNSTNSTCQTQFIYFAISAYFGNCADADDYSYCPAACQRDVDSLLDACACGDIYAVDDDTGEISYWQPGSAEGIQVVSSDTCSIAKDQCAGYMSAVAELLLAWMVGSIIGCIVCCGALVGGIIACCCLCQCCPVYISKQANRVAAQPCSNQQVKNTMVAVPVQCAAQPQTVMVQSKPQQPVMVQSQPVAVQSQPVAVQSQPVMVQSQPVAVQSQPVAVQSQPVVVQSQPVAVQSQPVVVQSQPVAVQPQPVAVQSQPVVVVADPATAKAPMVTAVAL